jgi:hypothetical protein
MGDKNTELKNQVMELLNQIVILTKGVKEPQQRENYNYQYEYITSDVLEDLKADSGDEEVLDVEGNPVTNVDDDQIYLYCVGKYAKRVIDGDASDAVHNENQYYNSNC